MSWIAPVTLEEASEEAKRLIADHQINLERQHKVAIELHNPVVYKSVEMNAWVLDDEVKEKVGGRYADLLETAISVTNHSVVCTRYFTRITKERYDIDVLNDPDFKQKFDEKDAVVWDFGEQLAKDIHGITEDVKGRLTKLFTPEQIVVLTGMAAVISADNIFESVLEID